MTKTIIYQQHRTSVWMLCCELCGDLCFLSSPVWRECEVSWRWGFSEKRPLLSPPGGRIHLPLQQRRPNNRRLDIDTGHKVGSETFLPHERTHTPLIPQLKTTEHPQPVSVCFRCVSRRRCVQLQGWGGVMCARIIWKFVFLYMNNLPVIVCSSEANKIQLTGKLML